MNEEIFHPLPVTHTCIFLSISISSVVSFMFQCTEFLLFLCLVSFDINTFLSFYASSKCSLSFLAPLEAILFDIDGTICDSDPLHYYAFRDMLQEVCFSFFLFFFFQETFP